ncbi:MAG: hypothetical protein KY475_24245, partial [Planctomycetes bacterium]|nr:hypothetical protein [Planctomycetota bacterium]
TVEGEPLAVLPDESGHDRLILYATFSPDGARLAGASHQGGVFLWDEEGRPIAVLETEGNLRGIAWRSDSSGLAAAVGHDLVLVSRDGERQAPTNKRQGIIVACHWKNDGQIVAADEHGGVRVFDAAGEMLDEWTIGVDALRGAAFNRQGRQLVAWQDRGAVYGVNVESHRPTFTMAIVNDQTIAFDGLGRLVNASTPDISPLLYCVETPAGFRLMTHEEFTAMQK